MARNFFGTDGIRGKVGEKPITPEVMLKLGWAAGRVLASRNNGGVVLIGKDTRLSGYMLESALEAGLSAAGVDIRLLGPMPTPGIAYLTRTFHASGGIVISASHNPYQDNGIKFFAASGQKLPDEVEEAIEQEMEKPMTTVASHQLGKAERVEDAGGRYIEFCKSTVPNHLTLKGMTIVVDCAHGATYNVAPSVFRELGAQVVKIGAAPDGFNINAECGTVHPEQLQSKVLEVSADLGIALDGDGDRVALVDHKGEVVDGDEILYIIAKSRLHSKNLGGTVVGTVMSNLGLEQALLEQGILFKRAKVGDRYVMEMLQKGGWILGGESSGHILCLDKTTTGDGIVSALQVLLAMHESGFSLHDLKKGMQKYPQELINIRVAQKKDPMSIPGIVSAVRQAESQMGGKGRVLLRSSGTEPLVRVMVEGRDLQLVKNLAQELAQVVKSQLSD